jgi:hypothetical protein
MHQPDNLGGADPAAIAARLGGRCHWLGRSSGAWGCFREERNISARVPSPFGLESRRQETTRTAKDRDDPPDADISSRLHRRPPRQRHATCRGPRCQDEMKRPKTASTRIDEVPGSTGTRYARKKRFVGVVPLAGPARGTSAGEQAATSGTAKVHDSTLEPRVAAHYEAERDHCGSRNRRRGHEGVVMLKDAGRTDDEGAREGNVTGRSNRKDGAQ